MRFLIDRCTGRRVALWLIQQGHDAVHANDIGTDPGDSSLLEMAVSQDRILVTIDTDFGKLVHLNAAAHSGIIRLPDLPVDQRIRILDQLLTHHSLDLQAKAMVTVRGNRIRITPQSSAS